MDNLPPVIDPKYLDSQIIYHDMRAHISKLLENVCTLKGSSSSPLSPPLPKTPSPKKSGVDSTIIDKDDLSTLKEWFPNKYALSLTLLYRGSRDGMNSQAFHSQCDGKGPTITLLRGQFSGSSNETVIGGYLDKDWNTDGLWIASNEAFVFSMTTKRKYPVSQPQFAAMSHSEYGPIFGQTGDIFVDRNFSRFYMQPGASYSNSAIIIQSKTYSGVGMIDFVPQEIVVFALR